MEQRGGHRKAWTKKKRPRTVVAMEKEDILENRFLTVCNLATNAHHQLLQTTYSQFYEDAQTNCWLVVVPQTSSLKGLRVTPEIAGSFSLIHSSLLACHILKPSPLFKEVYVVATKEERSCEIEDQYIVEKEGLYGTKILPHTP